MIAGLLMLAVLVVVHELGHFLAAKLFGIHVPVFSVGMGPRVFGVNIGGTDYRVSAFPIGGYVRMSGSDPFGEEDPDDEFEPGTGFMDKPVWQRLIVMVAGPAFNLILPFVVFTAVLMSGEPQSAAEVGYVSHGSPAERVGLEYGDRVLAVDGEAVEVWLDMSDAMTAAVVAGRTPSIQVERLGGGAEVVEARGLKLGESGYVDLVDFGIRSWRLSAAVGVDDPASPAAVAGVRTGDLIVEVDGAPVNGWESLQSALAPLGSHAVGLEREGERVDLVLDRSADWVTTLPGAQLRDPYGLVPGVVFVGAIVPESRAEAAGVQEGDRLVAVDGQPVWSWSDLTTLVGLTAKDHVEGHEPRSLALTVIRGGQVEMFRFAPEMVREVVGAGVRYRPVMGVVPFGGAYELGDQVRKYYGFGEAVPRAGEEVGLLFTGIMTALGNLFTGELKPQESLGGPIEIFRMAAEGASRGIFTYVRLIGTISISLGIINLLPVPVLDGGQILFYAVEGIRGRPLSLAVREKLQMVGVLLLVALMLFVAVNDVNRLITSW
jgi:regulator of sigma E protease